MSLYNKNITFFDFIMGGRILRVCLACGDNGGRVFRIFNRIGALILHLRKGHCATAKCREGRARSPLPASFSCASGRRRRSFAMGRRHKRGWRGLTPEKATWVTYIRKGSFVAMRLQSPGGVDCGDRFQAIAWNSIAGSSVIFGSLQAPRISDVLKNLLQIFWIC